MTDKTFAMVAGLLSSMPAQQRWDDGVAMAYGIVLRDIDDDVLTRAVIKLVKSEDFRPSPSKILRSLQPSVTKADIVSRIQRFIMYTHPSTRGIRELKWLSRGELKQEDLDAVAFLGGWNSIGVMTRAELISALEQWNVPVPKTVQALQENRMKAIQ
jgi:hypothetical protein